MTKYTNPERLELIKFIAGHTNGNPAQQKEAFEIITVLCQRTDRFCKRQEAKHKEFCKQLGGKGSHS